MSERGDGPPLVSCTDHSRIWRRQLAELADEFTVVAWDGPRGRRRSVSAVDLHPPEAPLGDGVVELRLLSSEDAPAFLDGLRDRAVAHYAYRDQLTAEETAVREYIARVPDRVAADDAVLLAVLDAATGTFVGETMLFHVDRDERSAELGFWLSPVSRGRGLAARAIRLTVRWAFDELGLERIQGLTDVENKISRRVMQRVGFVREGTLRGAERRADGTRRDLVSYSALVTDHTGRWP